jgi:hypothetical protein
VDGVQSAVGEQSPDEPRFEDEPHSQVEALFLGEAYSPDESLPGARPLDAAYSPAEERSGVRSLAEARLRDVERFRDEARFLAPECRGERRCSLAARPACWSVAEMRHDCLQGYKALLPLWPVRLHDR